MLDLCITSRKSFNQFCNKMIERVGHLAYFGLNRISLQFWPAHSASLKPSPQHSRYNPQDIVQTLKLLSATHYSEI